MYSIKINNKLFPIKVRLFRNIPILYEDALPQSEFTKIYLNSNNKIEIIKENQIIKEYILNPIIENFEESLYRMKNNDIICNIDIYEDLVPFKYIIKKVDNNLYYESFSFLFNNNIEK
jgi:hypothetical protein